MQRGRMRAITGSAGLLAWSGLVLGCHLPRGDTVHPQYAGFGVRRIGTLIWCTAYVAGDLAARQTPSIRPALRMTRAEKWDAFLSPVIQREIESTLRAKGYEVVDASSVVRFGEKVQLSEALAALAEPQRDLDAILTVVYCVSPLHLSVVNSDTRGNTTYTTYQSTTGGINLKGRLKLFHLPSMTTLWELGDHTTYYHGSYAVPEAAYGSKTDLATAVCRTFGSAFGQSSGAVCGFPACAAPE
jgi:hypothetical protein